MNVKLLKKVRERYEISLVTKVDPQHQMFGLTPFIALCDNENDYRDMYYRINNKQTKDEAIIEAKSKLLEWIRKDYSHTKKHYIYHSEKIWYK